MLRKETCLSIIIIISATFAATMVTLTGFGTVDIAQGQVNNSTSSLTPEQKAAICDPNNPSSNLNPVNTTESKICGIPATVRPPISNMTTGEETPPSTDLAPSVVPTPEEG
jgi:hypothetical protein